MHVPLNSTVDRKLWTYRTTRATLLPAGPYARTSASSLPLLYMDGRHRLVQAVPWRIVSLLFSFLRSWRILVRGCVVLALLAIHRSLAGLAPLKIVRPSDQIRRQKPCLPRSSSPFGLQPFFFPGDLLHSAEDD